LDLDRVTVRFGVGKRTVHALTEVSFSVEPGQTLGLVGESGSGKSTAAAVALGLRAPTDGAVRFAGEPLRRRRTAGAMQAVLQHPMWALNPRMTVAASIAEPLAVQTRNRALIQDRVAEMLASVSLDQQLADR